MAGNHFSRFSGHRRPFEERFWQKVDITPGCWLWLASLGNHGYGQLGTHIDGKPTMVLAHRVSWEIHFGQIPNDLFVLHDCDQFYLPTDMTYRRCVNPQHLRLGTPLENMLDRSRKGRHR